MSLLLAKSKKDGVVLSVPAGVLAQAWRDPRAETRLARFVASAQCEVVPLDRRAAKLAGQLCGATGTSDVVDASVVVCAHDRGQAVVTSDPVDLRRLDPRLRVLPI
jgi:alpha-beta hydrolase superfamily lysophospholipase